VTQNHVLYQHTKAFYHTTASHTTQNSMWHPQNVTGKQIIPYIEILTLVSSKPRCRILKETTDPLWMVCRSKSRLFFNPLNFEKLIKIPQNLLIPYCRNFNFVVFFFFHISPLQKNVYLPSLMTEVPDHVYVLFCFLTESMSVSAILVTQCAFNTIL
jgi:hypothetical protein